MGLISRVSSRTYRHMDPATLDAPKSQGKSAIVEKSTSSLLGAASGDARADPLDVTYEISRLLNTGISREKLSICIQLIELGVAPETLAHLMVQHNLLE